jgi:glycerate kinase
MGARIESGFDVIAGRLGLRETLRRADLVITGEGMLDPASYEGKVVGGVVRSARDMGVPSAVVVGQARAGMERDHDFVSLTERYGREASLADTARCIADATLEILAGGAGFTAR